MATPNFISGMIQVGLSDLRFGQGQNHLTSGMVQPLLVQTPRGTHTAPNSVADWGLNQGGLATSHIVLQAGNDDVPA